MFSWGLFKPSPKRLIDEIFKDFSEEELIVLRNTGSKCIPDVYSFLIEVCRNSKSRYSLRKSKKIAAKAIFPYRKNIFNKEAQRKILDVFLDNLFV